MSNKINALTPGLIAAMLLITLRFSSLAQTTSSSIQGHITDSNGEELAGVDVAVLFKPTNTKFSAITNRDGRFNFANLNPGGPYDVTLSFLGLKTENLTGIQLKLGEALKLDVAMKDETEQLSNVTVAGVTSTDNAMEKRGSGTNINKEQIQSLPTVPTGLPSDNRRVGRPARLASNPRPRIANCPKAWPHPKSR